MWGAITAIFSPLGEVAKTWLQGRQAIQEAKIEREVKALTHEANWDEVQAQASQNSWKDEWLTILISIPLIMAFVPGMEAYIYAGFKVLEDCPDWYQYLVGVVFAASFGIKKVTDILIRRK